MKQDTTAGANLALVLMTIVAAFFAMAVWSPVASLNYDAYLFSTHDGDFTSAIVNNGDQIEVTGTITVTASSRTPFSIVDRNTGESLTCQKESDTCQMIQQEIATGSWQVVCSEDTVMLFDNSQAENASLLTGDEVGIFVQSLLAGVVALGLLSFAVVNLFNDD